MRKTFFSHWRGLIVITITIKDNGYKALDDLTVGVNQNAATFIFISLKNMSFNIYQRPS